MTPTHLVTTVHENGHTETEDFNLSTADILVMLHHQYRASWDHVMWYIETPRLGLTIISFGSRDSGTVVRRTILIHALSVNS